MRARLALTSSGVLYEHREIVLRLKPPEMLAASPKGTVPVLILPGGRVIDQSLEIMLWALEQNDPNHWLSPQFTSIGDMLALIAANDGPFKQHLDRYKYPNRYLDEYQDQSDQTLFARSNREAAASWLMCLERFLKHDESSALFGTSVSLADMALLPFVRQFAHTDRDWFAMQPWPKLLAWLSRFETSVLFQSVMCKHPLWEAAPEISSS